MQRVATAPLPSSAARVVVTRLLFVLSRLVQAGAGPWRAHPAGDTIAPMELASLADSSAFLLAPLSNTLLQNEQQAFNALEH